MHRGRPVCDRVDHFLGGFTGDAIRRLLSANRCPLGLCGLLGLVGLALGLRYFVPFSVAFCFLRICHCTLDIGCQSASLFIAERLKRGREEFLAFAANMVLTETEATRFWPVYDQYVAEMTKHNDEFFAVIKDYAANQKTLTDNQASSMIKRWVEIQIARDQLRQKFIPLFEKAIPGRKVALFFQIDRRLYALLDLQVSSEIPLVVQQ